MCNSILVSDINNSLINWPYYSSLDKLVRHLAWILKLKRNWVMCQRGKKRRQNFSYLTKNDIEFNLQQLLQISQIESYPNEYSDLLQGKRVSSQSKILDLTPIFNENLIKVGGCLQSAEIPVKNKHQIVVSITHSIATLIIQEIHQRNLHIGREHTLSVLREKYWIPSCRGIIRKLSICKLYIANVKMLNQIIQLWEIYHLIEPKWEISHF